MLDSKDLHWWFTWFTISVFAIGSLKVLSEWETQRERERERGYFHYSCLIVLPKAKPQVSSNLLLSKIFMKEHQCNFIYFTIFIYCTCVNSTNWSVYMLLFYYCFLFSILLSMSKIWNGCRTVVFSYITQCVWYLIRPSSLDLNVV